MYLRAQIKHTPILCYRACSSSSIATPQIPSPSLHLACELLITRLGYIRPARNSHSSDIVSRKEYTTLCGSGVFAGNRAEIRSRGCIPCVGMCERTLLFGMGEGTVYILVVVAE